MFGNDQVSEMFVSNTILDTEHVRAGCINAFLSNMFLSNVLYLDCITVISVLKLRCSKKRRTVVYFGVRFSRNYFLEIHQSNGIGIQLKQKFETGIIFVAREYRFRVSVPGTSKIGQIAHFC